MGFLLMCILKRARRIHRAINKRCFNGELPSIKFNHWRDNEDSAQYQGEYTANNDTQAKSYIAVNALHNTNYALLFDTVAHEMVHQFQHITKGYELGHGGDFIDMMLSIETEFNITLQVEYDY